MPVSIKTRLAVALAASMAVAPALAADAVLDSDVVPTAEEIAQRSILLGIGGGFQPLYEGSDEYRAFPFPIFSYDSGVEGPRRFEFRGLDDIRLHAIRMGNFSAGPIAGWRFGREESDSARLTGLGDIDGGLVVGGFASYDFAVQDGVRWGADIGVSTQVTGDPFDDQRFAGFSRDYGYEVDFGLSNETAVNDRLNIATRVGAVYADRDYMRTNFGVSTAQAASALAAGNTAITAFEADGGIKNAYVNVNATYDLTDKVQLRAGAGYSRLLNDAAKSPVTESKDQFSGSVGVAYRFLF